MSFIEIDCSLNFLNFLASNNDPRYINSRISVIKKDEKEKLKVMLVDEILKYYLPNQQFHNNFLLIKRFRIKLNSDLILVS
jgi:hypothetical protein